MNLFKLAGAAIVTVAAVGFVIANELEQKKKDKELDEFLLSDETEPVVVDVPVVNGFDQDILAIKESPVTISFRLADKDKCLLFQDLLSEKGLSSELSSEALRVDVIFNDEASEDNLKELVSELKNVLDKVEAKYEGCH